MMKKNKVMQPDKVAGKLAKGLWLLQVKWSAAMSKIERTIPFRKKRWMVILFALTCSSYFLFIAIRSVTNKQSWDFTVQSIQRPAHVIQPETKEVFTIPEREQHKIRVFQRYMDSLQTTKEGQRIYDSIIHARPGLMDSIKIISELLQQ